MLLILSSTVYFVSIMKNQHLSTGIQVSLTRQVKKKNQQQKS